MIELLERIEGLLEGKSSRAHKYGEVYRRKHGENTIVVRGVYKARGDVYHVRMLRGAGKPSDERKKGNVMYQGDLKAGDYETPDAAVAAAVKTAAKGYG